MADEHSTQDDGTPTEQVEALVKAFHSGQMDEGECRASLAALGGQAVQPLLRLVRQIGQPVKVRVMAVRALADLGDIEATPALIAVAAGPDLPAALRRALRIALRSLSASGSQDRSQ